MILWSILILCPVAAMPQRDTLPVFSLTDVYRQNYWLLSDNPISLTFNKFHSFSLATAAFSHRNGNPWKPTQPTSANQYSLGCQSFRQMGKISLYGNLSYSLNKARRVSLNGMTNDYWQAVHLYDSISGNRRSEKYRLAGGISLPVAEHWLIGARADYRVEQTAKDTDPRHKNQWMAWQFTPGAGYRYGKTRLGLSLYYSVKKEEIDYRNMGNQRDYPILIGYPLGYNQSLPQQQSANWHYTGQETGTSLQIDIPLGHFRFFQQIQGKVFNQEVISNRIQNHKEADTDGWQIAYKGHLQRQTQHTRQEWSGYMRVNRFRNYDPLQEQLPSGTWHSQGEVLRSSRQAELYALKYKYERLNKQQYPCFTFLSGILYYQTSSSLFFYPTGDTQSHHHLAIHSTAIRTLSLKRSQLKLSLGGHYRIPLQWGLNSAITYTRTTPLSWFVRLKGTYISEKSIAYGKIETQFGWLF